MGKRRECLGELYESCDISSYSGSSYVEFTVEEIKGCAYKHSVFWTGGNESYAKTMPDTKYAVPPPLFHVT